MGVWAGGPSATEVDLPGIATAMRPALEQWFSAHIKIFDPKRGGTVADYDALADTGGGFTPELVFDSGANGALVQPLGATGRIEYGGQPNSVMGIRFQVKIGTPTVPLRGGLLIQVVDPGNAQIPGTWRFSIVEDADSSLMWDRIIHATLVTGGV